MRELTRALQEGAQVENVNNFIKNNEKYISRISLDNGKYKYDIPQVELLKNVGGVFLNSLSEVLSYSEQFREAENLTPEENLKKWEEWEAKRSENRSNLKRLKQEGIETLVLEPSTIQSFGGNALYHGARQYADIRQLPLLGASKLTGAAAGKYMANSFMASASPAAKKAFEIFTKGTSEAIESGIEEYTDQLTTEDQIDPETIFYSAVGSFIMSTGISSISLAKNRISKEIRNAFKEPKKTPGIETPQTAAIKEAERVVEAGGDIESVKAADLKPVAEDVSTTTESLGKPILKNMITDKVIEIEGATPYQAREVYGPIIFKKVAAYLEKNSDDLGTLKDLRNMSKKEPKKLIGYINDIMANENLTPGEIEAFEWGKRILDDKRIKGINFSTKVFLENTYEAFEKPKVYDSIYSKYEKGFNVNPDEKFINPYLEKVNYETAIENRVKHNYKYKKNVVANNLKRDLNIPQGAKIKSVNAGEVILDGKKTEVADIEWEYKGNKYYSKVEKVGKKYEGSIYKENIGQQVFTKEGKREIKKAPIITRTETPKEFIVSQKPSVQKITREAFMKKHPELSTEEKYLKYLSEDPDRAYVEIVDMIATDKDLSAFEKLTLQEAANKLDQLSKKNKSYDFEIERVEKHKPQITRTMESAYSQDVTEVFKRYIDGIESKEDMVNLIKKDLDKVRNYVDEILTNPDVNLTQSEEEALNWLRLQMKEPKLSDFPKYKEKIKKPVVKKIISQSKPLWENYPFTEMEVSKEYFEQLLDNRSPHNYNDLPKRQVLQNLKEDLNIPEEAKVRFEDIRGHMGRETISGVAGKDLEGKAIPRNYKIKTDYYANIVWEHNGYLYYADTGIYVPGEGYKGDIYKTKSYGRPTRRTLENMFSEAKEIPSPKKIEPTNPMEEIFGFPEEPKVNQEVAEKMAERAAYSSIELEELKDIAKEEAAEKVSDILKLTDEEVNNKNFVSKTRGLIKEVGKRIREKYGINSLEEAAFFYKSKYGIDFEIRKAKSFAQGVDRLAELVVGETPDGQRKYIVYIGGGIKDEDIKIGALRHELEHLRDFLSDEEFSPRTPEYTPGSNIEETIKETYRGHFKNYGDNSFELSYIINNEMANILNEAGIPNMKVIRNLGLDIPKELDKESVEALKGIIEKSAKETDPAKRIETLQKETSKFFSLKRKYENIIFSELKKEQKPAQLKQLTETEIILPFQKSEQAMKNKILSGFKMEANGKILGPEEILDLFEENKADAGNFLFYNGKLPESLKEFEPQLLEVKNNIHKIIDELSEENIATPQDIINTLNYDNRLSLEKLLSQEEIKTNLGDNGELDIDKLTTGKTSYDELTEKITPEKTLSLRERFADQAYEYFNDSYQALKIKARNATNDPKGTLRALKRAKSITPGEELRRIVVENNLDVIPEIKEFLDKHPEFLNNDNPKLFENTEAAKAKLEEARLQSKKDTAKIFFTEDMSSVKGTEKNPASGTFAHKLSRFRLYENEGYIKPENVSKFVKSRKVNPRRVAQKYIDDVSSAWAIKETFPKDGYKFLEEIFSLIRKESSSTSTKDYVRELEKYIESNLGEKLGLLTKPTKNNLDRATNILINVQNRLNLAGPKALQELFQEPIGIIRDNMMLYGGEGFLKTYKEIIKSIVTTMQKGEDLNKINISLGDIREGSVPLEMFNIIAEELNDLTGYKKSRIMQHGSKGDKIYYNFNNAMEKVNMYGYTQQWLKLTSHKLTADNIIKISKNNSLEEVFKNSTAYLKTLLKNLEFEDVDLKILKELENTENFINRNILDKTELSERITKKIYDDFLNNNISFDEFNIRKQNSMNKIEKLYNQMVKDISPTETTGAMRSHIEMIEDPVTRNFMRLTANFKNSIQEQWRRMYKSYYLSNITPEGNFDWTNKVYQKRLANQFLDIGLTVALISLASDKDFYVDPIETISEKIDNLIDNPESALWGAIEEQTNLWGLTTGSNVVRRPIQIINQISEREYKKAGETMLKAGLNNYNYDILKGLYDYTTE